ncbi:MAG: hypothetical protein AMQ74_00127 [Candidatus Methanofastidiosum methylothiophilum]|uniref:DUF131 domain-containing protein n=1 Tax=Candidatus Methanofastidiosum methylothiophilum TaxID=1705564 RepID=A0A150JAQ9_9EURY|nr:MAG: hypothetical protein AMQ74_00127 [Candidatus Methanofastidiosum methylthiophilus]
MVFERLVVIGLLMVIIGVLLIFIATVFSTFKGTSESNIETGGILLIGPIPIIFGNSKPLIILSIGGAILMVLVYFLFSRGDFL